MLLNQRRVGSSSIVAIGIFVAIIFSIPWEVLQGVSFADKENYIEYFTRQENILAYKDYQGVIGFISNEVLWHWLIPFLNFDVGIELDTIFNAITILTFFIFSLYLVRRHHWLYLVLLVNPLLITFAFSQLRMALAYSIVLTVYMARKWKLAWVFLLPAVLIHSSIVVFLIIYGVIYVVQNINLGNVLTKWANILIFSITGVVISIAIGPLRAAVLGLIGDRRAGYGDASSSVLYTLFWIGMLGLCFFQRRSFYRDDNNRYAIVILSLVSVNILTGGYTLRFLSVGLPMIISAMLCMDADKRKICMGFYLAYLAFLWFYWFGMKPF